LHEFDEDQQKAFEIIVAAFVLTFYDEATFHAYNDNTPRNETNGSTFRRETNCLKKLVRQRHKQLICFLHGHGGSRKSTVIDLVLEYAK
jgi:hypothetical protein